MNLETRIRSVAMRRLSSAGFQRFRQRRARIVQRLTRQPRTVHYFHQVDDPYSHLAVQKLDALRAAYRVPFSVHLVSRPDPRYLGSAELFADWALRDACSIAAAYGVSLPATSTTPDRNAVANANARLAPLLEQPGFAADAVDLGEQIWSGQPIDVVRDPNIGAGAVAEGNALRARLGHYLGGTFCFEGEWYWGVDRLRLLERRLIDAGLARGSSDICVPEPSPADATGLNARDVRLEYFPSLRSPYTAIGHRRVVDLIARSGVTVELRPVMPMLMRGVPAPGPKQRYIITDAAREGRAHGAELGVIVDPFGEPVKRAFALFPGAVSLGKGMDFVTAYLDAAWVDGVDITTDAGLRRVASRADIEWQELQQACQGTDWQSILDDNLAAMLGAGLWGVPSFRVTGGNGEAPYACWGQDRIWRVEHEIASRA